MFYIKYRSFMFNYEKSFFLVMLKNCKKIGLFQRYSSQVWKLLISCGLQGQGHWNLPKAVPGVHLFSGELFYLKQFQEFIYSQVSCSSLKQFQEFIYSQVSCSSSSSSKSLSLSVRGSPLNQLSQNCIYSQIGGFSSSSSLSLSFEFFFTLRLRVLPGAVQWIYLLSC